MTWELGLIAACVVILFGAAGCVAILSRVVYPTTVGWLRRLAPATRANFLLAWAASPLCAALVILVFILAPSIAHLVGLGADHCHAHDHHAHLCLVHTAFLTGGTLEQLILGGAIAVVLVWAFGIGLRLAPAHRAIRLLLVLGKPSPGLPDYHVVQSTRPFAVTAGLMRPRVLLSSRLLDELEPPEVATVISHERAHQRRRDGLRLLAAEILSGLHPPSMRHFILGHLRLAIEQACDEVAARQSGDRIAVAETILKMARLAGASRPIPFSVGQSFVGADATLRVEGLLRSPLPLRPWIGAGASVFIGLLIAVGLATSDWWHHSAESLLGFYLG